ncbi:unnamed protein product [Malus baccata var. baccata]
MSDKANWSIGENIALLEPWVLITHDPSHGKMIRVQHINYKHKCGSICTKSHSQATNVMWDHDFPGLEYADLKSLFVDFVEIDHSCSVTFLNLIEQGINKFSIILKSLQLKDWRAQQNIICRFGIPHTMLTDNGLLFTSSEVTDWYKQLGIRYLTFTSRMRIP